MKYLLLYMHLCKFIIPVYKKRMSREMKETHILLQQFFGDKLCPSGQYPLLGNICLEDNNSDEIDLGKTNYVLQKN